jgi:hypothetical protein
LLIAGHISNASAQQAQSEVTTSVVVAEGDSVKTEQFPIVKREIKAADQIKVGTTIMVFVIIVMTLMNNYNPE